LEFRCAKKVFPTYDQINKLLIAPNTKTIIGLRDKTIIKTFLSTGLKVGQLKNLNRGNLNLLPGEIHTCINDYLKTRKDKNDALFINYRSKKMADKRLTDRSIERIIKFYGEKVGIPFVITPEILRWSRVKNLLDEEVVIEKINKHFLDEINFYNPLSIFNKSKYKNNKSPTPGWHIIENAINREKIWLKNNVPTMPENYKENPSFLRCDECISRKIAILIIAGRIKAAEYYTNNDNMWREIDVESKINRHGKDWHRKMMTLVQNNLNNQGFDTFAEPILNYGRADLGFVMKNINLYVEIGTVSLFKIWYNLSTMKNTVFLLVPSENKIIEFKT